MWINATLRGSLSVAAPARVRAALFARPPLYYAPFFQALEVKMGKGDKRTRKGKLFRGSYGKTRPHKPKRAKQQPASR
jgi:30S ribosomal protein S31